MSDALKVCGHVNTVSRSRRTLFNETRQKHWFFHVKSMMKNNVLKIQKVLKITGNSLQLNIMHNTSILKK